MRNVGTTSGKSDSTSGGTTGRGKNFESNLKKRLREFETYSKLSFLKQYDSNEYIKRFVLTEDDPVADFFQDDESNRVNVLPHDRSKLQKFIAMHLPHNNTGLFYYSFRSRTVLFKRHASRILKRLVKP